MSMASLNSCPNCGAPSATDTRYACGTSRAAPDLPTPPCYDNQLAAMRGRMKWYQSEIYRLNALIWRIDPGAWGREHDDDHRQLEAEDKRIQHEQEDADNNRRAGKWEKA